MAGIQMFYQSIRFCHIPVWLLNSIITVGLKSLFIHLAVITMKGLVLAVSAISQGCRDVCLCIQTLWPTAKWGCRERPRSTLRGWYDLWEVRNKYGRLKDEPIGYSRSIKESKNEQHEMAQGDSACVDTSWLVRWTNLKGMNPLPHIAMETVFLVNE